MSLDSAWSRREEFSRTQGGPPERSDVIFRAMVADQTLLRGCELVRDDGAEG
jgi:hypothetical protein